MQGPTIIGIKKFLSVQKGMFHVQNNIIGTQKLLMGRKTWRKEKILVPFGKIRSNKLMYEDQ